MFHYKYIVGKGNNSMLVRMALKQRWWWCKGTWEDYNFVWMQLKSKKALEAIKSLKEGIKEFSEISDSETLSTKANTEIDGGVSISQVLTPSKTKRSNTAFKSGEKNNCVTSKKVSSEPFKRDLTTSHNHLESHFHLSNKKALFYNFKTYMEHIGEDAFKYIPLTFHIKEGVNDKEFHKFSEHYHKL